MRRGWHAIGQFAAAGFERYTATLHLLTSLPLNERQKNASTYKIVNEFEQFARLSVHKVLAQCFLSNRDVSIV